MIWKKAPSGLVAAAATALVAGACSDADFIGPGQPPADGPSLFGAPAAAAGFERNTDALFTEMAKEIPGFGGMYYDEAGQLNVYMAASARPMAQASLSRATSSRLASLGIAAQTLQAAKVKPGDYDFATLARYRKAVNPAVFAVDGVVSTDVDEMTNRVVVGHTDQVSRADLERAVQIAGVPLAAVEFRETAPMEFAATLREAVRPTGGGLEIGFDGMWVCTLGFNVRGGSVHGFVTNSHCTTNQGGVDGTQYRQPFGGPVIATEAWDLEYWSDPVECYAGWVCRYSDSAGALYADGTQVELGRIYKTTGVNTLSLTIDGHFTIVGEKPFPLGGETYNKVGRTTGWSAGPVVQTCVDFSVSGTNIVQLCQDAVAATVGGGDSGSPVFEIVDGTNVRLAGILWGSGGGTFAMSAMENIRFENVHPQGFQWVTH